jgi:tRNA(Leu) C34 or U34 (ribose-2'-O)-methylase TrmL
MKLDCFPLLKAEAFQMCLPNLFNCVALVLYEALRQNGFAGEI